MSRYTVTVTALVLHVQRFDVDADSQELAEEKAEELMEDMFPDLSEITDMDTEKHERDPDDARDEEMDRDLNR
jgi:hypothetical protein